MGSTSLARDGASVGGGKDVPVLVGLIGVTAQMLASEAHRETVTSRLTDQSSESNR